MKHILVIGGTGMLAEAVIQLASRCEILTLVARTETSLALLDQSTKDIVEQRHLLCLDWSDHSSFLESLLSHVQDIGEPSLVLAWLHDDFLGPKIAAAIINHPSSCLFYQVRGSAAGAPDTISTTIFESVNLPPKLFYHQIILGFKIDGAESRWLRNSEISDGVLTAIDNPSPVTVVGTLKPWALRP